jgi:hypothetical protein
MAIEVLFEDRSSAVKVLNEMKRIIVGKNHVTISDLYNLVGESPTITEEHFGWTDLTGSRIRRVRKMFRLDFPQVESLRTEA